jgi:hypothetical protein
VLRLVVAPGSAPEPRYVDRHLVLSAPDGSPVAYGWRVADDHWLSVPDVATFRFRPGSETVLGYAEPEAEPDWVSDAYCSHVLPMAIQIALGRQAVHASGVLSTRGVAAFCGDSQSGKTTIAYGLNRRGHALWGDDIIALATPGHSAIRSVRAPFALNLRPASAEYFHQNEHCAEAPPETAEWETAAVRLFCVLEVQARPSSKQSFSLERLPPKHAFLALLNHAWTFEPLRPEAERNMMRDYLEVIARAPVFRLRYAKDFAVLPRVLDAIEALMLQSSS